MATELAIIGPFPPPIGGIAIPLQRLLPYLQREDIDYFVYNTSGSAELPGQMLSVASNSRRWFLRYLFTSREPVVYIMTNQWPVWASSWILSRVRGKKVVLSFHSEEITWALEGRGRLRRALIEAGFEVMVVTDATAGAITEHYDGYAASLVNFRMIASKVDNTASTLRAIATAYE